MQISLISKIRRWRRLRFGWQWYRGDYPDWASARAASAGYDDAEILARVVAATRAVHSGQASWERDGTLFHEPAFNEQLLKILASCGREDGGLEVVDFGGSLGSTWWQNRERLDEMGLVAWRIVEQPHFVQAGAEFANRVLNFHASIDEACAAGHPNVLLLSGVLQCIDCPGDILRKAADAGLAHIVLDRTPFVLRGRTRLAVQHTPPELGGGTYPCWHFDQGELLSPLNSRYELIESWDSKSDDVDLRVSFRGLHLRRRWTGANDLGGL